MKTHTGSEEGPLLSTPLQQSQGPHWAYAVWGRVPPLKELSPSMVSRSESLH